MAKEAAKKVPDSAADAKPKGKKLVIVLFAAVAVLAIGAGAALFLLAGSGGEEKGAASKHSKAPIFVNLEPFTVNLQPENGEQYLQVVTTLKIADKDTGERIKVFMPEMRHRILLLLSGKKPSDIATPEGREALAEEIRDESNRILDTSGGKPVRTSTPVRPIGKISARTAGDEASTHPDNGPVIGVLFTSFIIQ